MTQEKRFENYDVRKVYDLNSHYGFLRCYREVKAEARMKLCQTEMVEVDLLRKQFMGVGIPAMGAGEIGSNPIDLVKRWMQAQERIDAYI